MSDSAVGLLILFLSCCVGPVLLFLLVVKLIIRFSPHSNLKLVKSSTFYDFLTFRGLFIFIFSVILAIVGYNNRYLTDFLILGVFLSALTLINLFVCFILKIALELKKKQIEFILTSDTFYADQALKVSKINIPIISKLIYIFPTKIELFIPDRLGGDLHFELNSGFFATPEFMLPKSKRGRYEIGPMIITFNDFFGLIQTKVFFDDKKLIHILPHYENLQNLNQKFLQKSYRDHRQVRKIINDENYFDIKEYTPQDDTRRINWKLTARTGEILVRKPESVNLYIKDSITIFIDNSYTGTTNDVVKDAFDRQVSIAATLSNYYYKHGSQVKLCYLDNSNSVQIYKGNDFNSFLKFLCLLEFNNRVTSIGAASSQSIQVLERGKTIQIMQGNDVSRKGLETLKEESLIYIYNSLTNPNNYAIFNNEYKNVVKNICVDVKTFITSEYIKPQQRKLYKIIFTKEYFATKDKKEKDLLNQQWLNYIQSRNVLENSNTVVVKSNDSLSSVLN